MVSIGYTESSCIYSNFIELLKNSKHLTQPGAGYKYLYDVRRWRLCDGMPASECRIVTGDDKLSSVSWTNAYDGMPPHFASQRRTEFYTRTETGNCFKPFAGRGAISVSDYRMKALRTIFYRAMVWRRRWNGLYWMAYV
jgi:hypothetical protein